MFITIFGDDLSGLNTLFFPFVLFMIIAYIAGALAIIGCIVIIFYGNAVRCRDMALKKGYTNSTGWFIFGMFFTYIVTLVCLLLKNRAKPVQAAPEQAADPADFKPTPEAMAIGVRCTDCDIVNPPDAKTCIQCGKRLF